jgi:hypothetical protein
MLSISERVSNEYEVIRKALDQFGISLRVACPGIIQTFDPIRQTVTVSLAIKEKVLERVAVDTPSGKGIGVQTKDKAIPVLVDIPIVVPRAGGFTLALPIQYGDECLVIFGDNCIDAWYQSGGVQNQMDCRRHDLSDGFAILAPWSQPRVIVDYPTSNAQLRDDLGTNKVEITPTSVNVTSTSEVNVKALRVNVTGGDVKISGSSVEMGVNTIIDNKVFLQHQHTSVRGGSDNSGPVL